MSSGIWGRTSRTVSAMASILATLSFGSCEAVLKCKLPVRPSDLPLGGGMVEALAEAWEGLMGQRFQEESSKAVWA